MAGSQLEFYALPEEVEQLVNAIAERFELHVTVWPADEPVSASGDGLASTKAQDVWVLSKAPLGTLSRRDFEPARFQAIVVVGPRVERRPHRGEIVTSIGSSSLGTTWMYREAGELVRDDRHRQLFESIRRWMKKSLTSGAIVGQQGRWGSHVYRDIWWSAEMRSALCTQPVVARSARLLLWPAGETPAGLTAQLVADDGVMMQGQPSAAAVALFVEDDWVWSEEVDYRCPFGSSEGRVAVREFREWRVEHPLGAVASFLERYLRELDGPTLRRFVEGRPDRSRLRTDPARLDEFEWSAGVLAVVLGQFIDEGAVDDGLGAVLRAALDRLLVWDEVESELQPAMKRVYRDHLHRLQVLADQIPERPK